MGIHLFMRGKGRPLVSSPLRRTLRRQFERVLKAAGLPQAEVSLSLSDDAELYQLNQRYAGEDHPTDVLSFAQPKAPHAQTQVLGDIIISVEIAQRQAEAGGHSLLQELLHLSVHGLCHLLGYDHATKAEEHVMFGYEAQLREQAQSRGRVRPILAPEKVA